MLSDQDILAAIDAEESAATGSLQGDVSSDRAEAINRYLGKPYGDEQPGRSAVVSRDVSDVVEGVVSNVLKPFVCGDDVVKFTPRGPEDVEAADQESDFINYVCMERNNGFMCLSSAVKDALLLRNGYVKAYWHIRDDVTLETYQGLSDDELVILASDKEVEIVSHEERPDPYAVMDPMPPAPQMAMGQGPMNPPPMPMLHDIKCRRAMPVEFVKIEPTPPDEILVSNRAKEPSLQECDFVQHRTHVMLSELRQMGYDVADDISDDEDAQNLEEYSRTRFGNQTDEWFDVSGDPARRLVLFKESWLRVDHDQDGIAELRRVCTVGQNILANEECDLIPIACFSGVTMPHQHLGISIFDLVKDIAEQKTAVWRQYLDNLYRSNNVEFVIDANRANIDDFLISRPGGLKRVDGDPASAAVPLVTPQIGAAALQGLEYLDQVRENRTGYTRSAQGLSSNALATDTLGEYEQQVSQSSLRLEMIARTIAETGVRDMFRIVHALTLKHSTKEEKVRLRNKWVTINPREWVKRLDLSISVGLGTASQGEQVKNLMLIGQAQQQAISLGIVTPANVYATLKKLVVASGYRNPEEFFTEPQKRPKMGPNGQPVMGPDGKPVMEDAPAPQPKDPSVQAAEIKAQTDMQKGQMDAQARAQEMHMKHQQDMQKFQAEQQVQLSNDQRQSQLDQQKFAFEQAQAEREHALEIERMNREFAFKEWEAKMRAELALQGKVLEASQPSEGGGTRRARSSGGGDGGATKAMMDMMQKMHEHMTAPREIVRGKDGKAIGVRVVTAKPGNA